MNRKETGFLDKPLAMMTGEDLASLLKYTFPEMLSERRYAHGIRELMQHLGCGLSKAHELSRIGVFEKAVVSSVGKRKVYDVDMALKLASDYQKNNNNKK